MAKSKSAKTPRSLKATFNNPHVRIFKPRSTKGDSPRFQTIWRELKPMIRQALIARRKKSSTSEDLMTNILDRAERDFKRTISIFQKLCGSRAVTKGGKIQQVRRLRGLAKPLLSEIRNRQPGVLLLLHYLFESRLIHANTPPEEVKPDRSEIITEMEQTLERFILGTEEVEKKIGKEPRKSNDYARIQLAASIMANLSALGLKASIYDTSEITVMKPSSGLAISIFRKILALHGTKRLTNSRYYFKEAKRQLSLPK